MRVNNLLLYLISILLCAPQWLESATSGQVALDGITYDYFAVNPETDDIRLIWEKSQGFEYGDIKTLRDDLANQGIELIFATNAGIFELAYEQHKPLGLHIEAGREIVPLNRSEGRGNFYWKPNGIFAVSEGRPIILVSQLWPPKTTVQYASQSGPLLVVDNKIHLGFKSTSQSKHIRNGVGIRESGEAVFAISLQPVTMWEFAIMFRDRLKCTDALYLDGSISKMYAPQLGRTDMYGFFAGLWAVVNTIEPR